MIANQARRAAWRGFFRFRFADSLTCCASTAVFTSCFSSGGGSVRADAEGVEPELAAPAFRVVEVLVLFILDLFVSRKQLAGHGAFLRLGAGADQFPVGVVLGLGQHDAFTGDQLGRRRIAGRQRHLHRLDQRLANVLHHLASRGALARIDSDRGAEALQDDDVVFGLREVFLPLVPQVVVAHAFQGGAVNEDAALLVHQRLQQEFLELRGIHAASGSWHRLTPAAGPFPVRNGGASRRPR